MNKKLIRHCKLLQQNTVKNNSENIKTIYIYSTPLHEVTEGQFLSVV